MLPFVSSVCYTISGLRFFVTDNGYMGFAPADVAVGDRTCLIVGVEVPMVLREDEYHKMEIIDACYCHGIMQSKGLQDDWDSKAKVGTFVPY